MKILFYKEGDRFPADDFLRSLPTTIEARFRYYLKHLQETRGIMQGVSFKKLHGYPMEEIRVKESRNLHRLIIQTRIGDLIIVLHGFTKKEGEATSQKELEIAYRRLSTIKT